MLMTPLLAGTAREGYREINAADESVHFEEGQLTLPGQNSPACR